MWKTENKNENKKEKRRVSDFCFNCGQTLNLKQDTFT